MKNIKKISFLLSKKEKKNFFYVFILILITAIFDTLGMVSILPFVAIISNLSLIETNSILSYLYEFSSKFGVSNVDQFILLLGSSFFILFISSLLIRAFANYSQINFALMLEYSISKRLIEKYLNQPFIWFLNRNSSDLGKNILSEVNIVINNSIIPLINLISQGMVVIAILLMLFIVDKFLTIIVGTVLILSYLLIFYFMRNILHKLGKERTLANQGRFKIISEALNSIKETKFIGLEINYVNSFSKPAKIFAKNTSIATAIATIPRSFIEGITFGGMILLILNLMSSGNNFANIVPIISLYAFAGYRLMPALQQIYSGISQLKFSGVALDKLYQDIINLEKTIKKPSDKVNLKFNDSIILKQLSFYYPNNTKPTIKEINLSINNKTKVGIVGKTGSGKTTIIDIILGLLDPKSGSLLVDGKIINHNNKRAWQNNIGYVPQQIYLKDSSIKSNIAFGINEENIDMNKIIDVSKIADLHDFVVDNLPQRYDTIVGERGIRLSGGQRQRIGIARALYNNPNLIIFDEATNSLDNMTENNVMNAIDKLNKKSTIIIVAHRLSTVKNCDNIFFIENGIIKKSGTYNKIFKSNEDLKKN